MVARGLLPSTINTREVQLNAFAQWLEPRQLDDATRDDVTDFLASRTGRDHGPISARTRASWLAALGEYYRWALQTERIAHDPTALVPRPKVTPGLPRPIGEDDLSRAVAGAGRRMRAWLRLAAWAGLRCCEIASLERDRIVEAEMILRVIGKGQKERIVPMHPVVWAALQDYGLPTRGPVFRRDDGQPYDARAVSVDGSSYLRGMGINATMHQLRHRFATRFHDVCEDAIALADTLGHASLDSGKGYALLNPKKARDAVNQIPVELFKRGNPRDRRTA